MAKRRKQKAKTRTTASTPAAKSSSAQTSKASTAQVSIAHRIAVALGVIGVLLTAYLTAANWFGEQPAFCTDGSGCDVVQESRWSTLFGLPLSLWGLLTYLAIVGLLVRQKKKVSTWRLTTWIIVFSFLFSVYLTVVSIVEIDATCAYCLASLGLISVLLLLSVWGRPKTLANFSWGSYALGTVGSAALLVVAIHMQYSGVFDASVGPEKPYLRGLAEHLTESGAVFYGAYWCPRCQDQKALFEASVHRLPYQECTPDGRDGPRALACINNRIEAFPTWIFGDERLTGVLTLKELSAISKYSGVKP